jgi:hypothetical protein
MGVKSTYNWGQTNADLADITQQSIVTESANTFTCDLSTGKNFSIVISDTAEKTLAFSNIPTGLKFSTPITVEVICKAAAVISAYPAGTLWKDDTAPTYEAWKKYLLNFLPANNGLSFDSSFVGIWTVLRNMLNSGTNYANWTLDPGSSKSTDGIHEVANGSVDIARVDITLTAGAVYTLIYNVTAKTLNSTMVCNGVVGSNVTIPSALGINKYAFTAPNPITTARFEFKCGSGNTDGTYINFKDIMCIPGDQTNNPATDVFIPYVG